MERVDHSDDRLVHSSEATLGLELREIPNSISTSSKAEAYSASIPIKEVKTPTENELQIIFNQDRLSYVDCRKYAKNTFNSQNWKEVLITGCIPSDSAFKTDDNSLHNYEPKLYIIIEKGGETPTEGKIKHRLSDYIRITNASTKDNTTIIETDVLFFKYAEDFLNRIQNLAVDDIKLAAKTIEDPPRKALPPKSD